MNQEKSTFNWFPGHMNKSIKEIEKLISVVDLVAYIIDSRAPLSTQNFIFKKILDNKRTIYLMSKSDISDKNVTQKWLETFNKEKEIAMLLEKNSSKNKNKLINFINLNLKDVIDRQKSRGYEKANLNVLVIGVPNVGKSTFINSIVKDKKVNAANKPGVTRGIQRIKLNDEITLIDSPGIAPSKFENKDQALICASANCLKIFDEYKEEVAYFILQTLISNYKEILENEFKISIVEGDVNDQEYLNSIVIQINKSLNKSDFELNYAFEQIISRTINYKITDISFERPA